MKTNCKEGKSSTKRKEKGGDENMERIKRLPEKGESVGRIKCRRSGRTRLFGQRQRQSIGRGYAEKRKRGNGMTKERERSSEGREFKKI